MTHSPADIIRQKADIRGDMKLFRASLSEAENVCASRLLCDVLAKWLESRAENPIAIYLALPTEINLDALGCELIRQNRIVCAPRIDAATGTMHFARLLDLSAVRHGVYNVREPISDEIMRPELAFVPGLAFDQNGARLGMGGGCYDRVLADISLKVGVCFGGQIVANVPLETHDVKMDWLASDLGLAQCELIRCWEHLSARPKSALSP